MLACLVLVKSCLPGLGLLMLNLCVCVRVCVCLRACVRACVRVYVCFCACVRVKMCRHRTVNWYTRIWSVLHGRLPFPVLVAMFY